MKWYKVEFYTNKPEEAINKLHSFGPTAFTGKIDNVRVYDTKLTKKDILKLYREDTK